ncbi:MAG: hypothetical protein C5B54_08235 [Acidobacteria bacterium]|nr:MAG: hypothetical protein C5B54_08235 [Acidobacteriota bacterium]
MTRRILPVLNLGRSAGEKPDVDVEDAGMIRATASLKKPTIKIAPTQKRRMNVLATVMTFLRPFRTVLRLPLGPVAPAFVFYHASREGGSHTKRPT